MLANVDNAASRAYRVQKYLLLFTDGTSSLSLGWDVSYKKKEIRHTIMITTFISCLSANTVAIASLNVCRLTTLFPFAGGE